MPDVRLKTRIQNKYKTLDEWNTIAEGELIPLKGEVLYAVDNDMLYQKIGDGQTDFVNLRWLINQGNWNENNELSPSYIKNRPFYSEIIETINDEIIPLQEIEFEELEGLEGMLICSCPISQILVENGQYNLVIDDRIEQITVSQQEEDIFVFGNLSLVGAGDDTGEDYVGTVVYGDNQFNLAYKTTETTHTIGLFYIDNMAPIIGENTYTFENNDGFTTHVWTFPDGYNFSENDIYNLTFNNETYENLTWFYYQDTLCIGNLALVGDDNDTGENYLLASDGSMVILATSLPAGEYSVYFEKSLISIDEVVNKIDNKYLDIKIPYTIDNSNNVTFENDILTSAGTSVNTLGTSVNTLETSVNTLGTSVNTLETSVEELLSIQVDYNQNDNTAKDYIKNRPFYKTENFITQTIYDSVNSDSPTASYNTTNTTYVSTLETDGTFENYIIEDSQVTIVQKITHTASKNTYYITRTGNAICNENIIFVGNLYLYTKNSNDHTGEDYLFYYDSNTNQLSLYFLSTAKCDDNVVLSKRASYLNNVDLTISTTVREYDCHKIDPIFLPDSLFETIDNIFETIEENSNIQPDFKQENSVAKDYIKNKPRIDQNYIILTDIANNSDYYIYIANGNLITHKVPINIEVTTPPIKTDYMRGETFDPTGMVLTAYYDNGTSEIVEFYSYPTEPLENCGNFELTVTAFSYKAVVPILVFHLDDFEYTDNNDGTYTITAWKGTLNGETSTEMIVPDTNRIKI